MRTAFAWLVICNGLILTGTAAVGLWATPATVELHILLAVFTLVVTCGIEAVYFTYFVVTGKLLTQAVSLGNMDAAPRERSAMFKRSAARWLAIALASIVAITITGALHWADLVDAAVHWLVVIGGLGVLLSAFYRQFDLVARNEQLLNETMSRYAELRRARAEATAG